MATLDLSTALGADPAGVRAPKTAELVAARIRTQVVRGQLRAGDALPPETRLMEQFGVSRPTLREAYRILESESLISMRRGSRGGAVITGPDPAVAARYMGLILQLEGTTIADVYEARTIFEPPCARLLAERRTEQDLTDLRACLKDLVALGEEGFESRVSYLRWSTLTARFHELITERSGNSTLKTQGRVLRDIIATHHEHSLAKGFRSADPAGIFRRSVRSYEKLIVLIEAGDGAAAEAHWAAHMTAAGKGLFRKDGGRAPIVDLFD